MWQSLFLLEGELAIKQKTVNWRMSAENFREPQINALQPGVLNIAPAWFEQGHDVRNLFHKSPAISNLWPPRPHLTK